MSKFHSTVSRRDFMKGLGLAGAGLGAAAAAAPVFHDLDELAAAPQANYKHPWWVKERDYGDITTEVDWSIYESYDSTKHKLDKTDKAIEVRAAMEAWVQQGLDSDQPGSRRRYRDVALGDGARISAAPKTPWDGCEPTNRFKVDYPGPYTGTPEDILQVVRSAFHFYGAPYVGVFAIDDHMKKLFNKNTVVWEDIDVAYQEGDVYHIPNKCQRVVAWCAIRNISQHIYGSHDDPTGILWQNAPIGDAAKGLSIFNQACVKANGTAFIKRLGYQTWLPSVRSNVPFGVFAGLGEQGRTSYVCTPDFGNMVGATLFVVTDMPIAPTKPIDAGVTKFCESCKRCAKECPSKGLSLDDKPTWDVTGPWNIAGYCGWHQNWLKCIENGSAGACSRCQQVCPFNHYADAIIHPMIRAAIATTPVFNSFFATMDEFMGYSAPRDPEEFWNRDLRTYRFDTLYGLGTGFGAR